MILRINTSATREASVQLERDGRTVQKMSASRTTTAQTVLPLIEELLQEQRLSLQDITAIEVHEGPGSYTGLRVGAAIAQTLSWTLNVPLNGKPPGTLPNLQYSASKYD